MVDMLLVFRTGFPHIKNVLLDVDMIVYSNYKNVKTLNHILKYIQKKQLLE